MLSQLWLWRSWCWRFLSASLWLETSRISHREGERMFNNLGIDPSTIPWWVWFLVGGAFVFVVQTFILPDGWSTWLALRRNGLTALLPFGLLALAIGIGNFLWALCLATIAAFKQITVAPWVMWLLLAGVFISALYELVRRRNNRPVTRR